MYLPAYLRHDDWAWKWSFQEDQAEITSPFVMWTQSSHIILPELETLPDSRGGNKDPTFQWKEYY